MRTTINELVGRRGDARGVGSVEDSLESARMIFADATRTLEREIDRLYSTEIDPDDAAERDRLRTVQDLIKGTQSALRTVLEIRAKLGQSGAAEKRQILDVEAARDEILRRFDRLAA